MTEASVQTSSGIFKKSLRAMAKLFAGSVAAKILTFLVMPFLTRLYLPDDFGVLGVFVACVAVLVPLVTMQFNHAIPIPRTDAMAANVATLALICSLVVSILLGVLLLGFAEPLLFAFNAAPLAEIWWLIPLAAFLIGLSSITTMWQTRRRRYGSLTIGSIFESALGNGTKLILGLWSPTALGLILGQIGNMTACFVLFTPTVLREVLAKRRQIVLRRLLNAARQYASFPAYRMPSQFISSVGMQLPVLYLAPVHGAAIAGQFSLAMLAISMPLNLIGRNLGKAFYAEAARVGRKEAAVIRSAMISIMKLLGAVGLALSVVLAFGGPFLFRIVFGTEWAMAGQFAAVLSVMLAANLLSSPLATVLSTFRREDVYLRIDVQRAIFAALSFGVAYGLALPPIETIALYSVVMVYHHLLVVSIIFRLISIT